MSHPIYRTGELESTVPMRGFGQSGKDDWLQSLHNPFRQGKPCRWIILGDALDVRITNGENGNFNLLAQGFFARTFARGGDVG